MSSNLTYAAALAAGGLAAAAAAWAALSDGTVDCDETGEAVAPPRAPAGGGLGSVAVAKLQAHLGEGGLEKKGKPGYHRGKFVDEVNRGFRNDMGNELLGEPWCARACRWAYEAAAAELGLPLPFRAARSSLSGVSMWRKALKGYELDAPKPGAVLLLGKQHAALVAQVLSPKEVVTVEGNHGDKVANVRRKIRVEDTLLDAEAFAAAGASPGVAVGWAWRGDLEALAT